MKFNSSKVTYSSLSLISVVVTSEEIISVTTTTTGKQNHILMVDPRELGAGVAPP